MPFDDAPALLAALEEAEVRDVLVGSMAMAARGIVKATQDIDFFVQSDEDNVRRLRDALRSVHDDESVGEIHADDLAGTTPVIRYGPPHGELVVDLTGHPGEVFGFDDIEADTVDIEGSASPWATVGMLYGMKRDTARPQDAADALLRQRLEREDGEA